MSSRWTRAARPAKPRMAAISPDLLADDARRVVAGIGDEPAAQLAAVGGADDDGIAALEGALHRVTPAGSRLLPDSSARSAPASISTKPLGSSWPAIQRLRAVTGSDGARNQVQGAPVRQRPQRVLHGAGRDDHVGAGGQRDLAGLDLGDHAAARQLGAGAAGHGLDLGRDLAHLSEALGAGAAAGRQRCRARRRRRAAPGNRRSSCWRRAPTGGRCRRSGSRRWPPCRSR